MSLSSACSKGAADMIHVGDITKLSGFDLPPVDCVTGGSPCQDLSVAGRRAGLAGERSRLFMEQVRVIKELRDGDRNRGRSGQSIRPRFMVWENVPGAFSSNHGEDFAAVLHETVKIAEPQAPPCSCTFRRLATGRMSPGYRMERCLASTRRAVLGSTPAKKAYRACRRFWRTRRTRSII